jgi:hypothetical protein
MDRSDEYEAIREGARDAVWQFLSMHNDEFLILLPQLLKEGAQTAIWTYLQDHPVIDVSLDAQDITIHLSPRQD